MRKLSVFEIKKASGGMNLNGLRPSNNIFDGRGKDMGGWLDANNICWKPNTPTWIMFPQGNYPRF